MCTNEFVNIMQGVVHKWRHAPSRERVHDIVTMRDVGGRAWLKDRVTSRRSHLRQGLAGESWMIALVHYTGLRGTARMAQATEIDVGLLQPVSPPTLPPPSQTAVLHQMCHIIPKILVVFETEIDL